MSVFTRLLPYLLLLCWSSSLFAQAPDFLLYQLTDEEAELLHKETPVFLLPGQKIPGKQAFIRLTKPIKAYQREEKFHLADLPPGHYVRAYIEAQQMAYYYDQCHPFTQVQILPNTKRSDFLLVHPSVPSGDLEVRLKGEKIDFQPKRGTFLLLGKRIRGLVTVICPEGRFFFQVKKGRASVEKQHFTYLHHLNEVSSQYIRFPRKWKYHAYMAFSQPRYRPGDTLRLKIFAVSKKGKALNEDLELRFGGKKIALLEPFRPGAYRYEIILHDSLDWRLDTRHTLQAFTMEKERYVTAHSFQYEDYLLDEITYEFRATKTRYEPGEDVKIIARGIDANGLPIADGEVEFTVKFGKLLAPPEKQVYIPYLITERTEALSQAPNHLITLPDSLFPKADAQYYINAKFRNSNNELQELHTNFSIKPLTKQPFIHSWRGDTLILAPHFGWTDSVKTTLVFRGRSNELFHQEILLPIAIKVSSDVSSIRLEQGRKTWSVPHNAFLPDVDFQVFREGDSVKVSIQNPNRLTLSYNIHTPTTVLAEGINSFTQTYAFFDPKGTHVTVLLQGHWLGRLMPVVQYLPYFDKRLTIDVEQPKKVLPGEKVNMTVTVTDEMGQPVPNVDLTAMGRNVTFPDQNLPALYSSTTSKKVKVTSSWETLSTEAGHHRNSYLDVQTVNHLQLDSLTAYRMRYPDSLELNYIPLDDTKMAEFSPFVLAKGNVHPIYFIYCNGQMIYFAGANSDDPYAFSLPAGTYSFTLRTSYKTFHLPAVTLKAGHKLELSLNALNLPAGVSSTLSSSALTQAEANELNEHFIWVKSDWPADRTAFVWQAGRAMNIPRGNTLQINKGYACVGPLPLSEAAFVMPGEFGRYFEVKGGQTYAFEQWNMTKGLGWRFTKEMPLPYPPRQTFGRRALKASDVELAVKEAVYQQPYAQVDYVAEGGDLRFHWKVPPAQVAFRRCDDPHNYWVASPTRLPEGCYCFRHRAKNGEMAELDSVWIKKDHLLAFPEMLIPYRDSVFTDSMWDSKYSIGYQGDRPFYLNKKFNQTLSSFKGKVISKNGKGIPHVKVIAYYKFSQLEVANSDENGEFVLHNADPDYQYLIFLHPSYSPAIDTLHADFPTTLIPIPQSIQRESLLATYQQVLKEPISVSFSDIEQKKAYIAYTDRSTPAFQPDDFFLPLLPNSRERRLHFGQNGFDSLEIVHPIKWKPYLQQSFSYEPLQGMLTGRVIAEGDRRPLTGAKIYLLDQADSVLTSTMTSISGKFTMKVSPLARKIRVYYPGYPDHYLPMGPYPLLEVRLGSESRYLYDLQLFNTKIRGSEVRYKRGSRRVSNWFSNPLGGKRKTAHHGELTTVEKYEELEKNQNGRYNYPQSAASDKSWQNTSIIPPGGEALFSKADSLILLNHIKEMRRDINLIMLQINNPGELNDSILSLREDFRDCAFWEPDLLTGPDGKVRFQVTYPEDITGWKTYVIGMNESLQKGMVEGFVQAYKPVTAQLYAPRFLVEGDTSVLIGKVVNRGGDSLQVETTFQQAGKNLPSQRGMLTDYRTDHQSIVAPSSADSDSLKLAYFATLETGATDGELREIPILRQGVEEKVGDFFYLEGDTSLVFTPKAGMGSITLMAQEDLLELLLDDARHLTFYPHDCNEQMASKLTAFLLMKQAKEATGQPFAQQGDLNQLARKLQKAQNDDGSWGWWKDRPGDFWMTSYVTKALARKDSTSRFVRRGQQYLRDSLDQRFFRNGYTRQLKGILSLAEMGIDMPYDYFFSRWEADTLPKSIYQQLLLTRTQQVLGLPYSLDTLLLYQKSTMLGGTYWGYSGWYWYGGDIETTLLAYQILKAHGGHERLLQRIRTFLLEKRGLRRWRNTIESARTLAVLIPDLLEQTSVNTLKSTLSITQGDDARLFDSFPLDISLSSGSSEPIQIKKQGGGPVYLTCFQRFWNDKPEAVDSLFRVKTHFLQKEDTLTSLKTSESFSLEVTVTTTKAAGYVVLKVPIPAGCVHGEGLVRSYIESYRERRKDRVNIYLRNLPPGTRKFRIPLEARFEGHYQLNPARVEMMYVPVKFGRNVGRRVGIGR